jgi:hypothetical protein
MVCRSIGARCGRKSSGEVMAMVQVKHCVGLAQGDGSQVMSHFDTESEFWQLPLTNCPWQVV